MAFYRDVLGMAVARRVPDLGLVHLRAGRALLDLVAVEGPLGRAGGDGPGPGGRNLDHFCLRIEPFEEAALRAHFAAHGVPVSDLQFNYGAEGTGPSVYLRDPEGNVLELKGPPGPAQIEG